MPPSVTMIVTQQEETFYLGSSLVSLHLVNNIFYIILKWCFKHIILYCMYIYLHVYLFILCVPITCGSQKRASGSLENEVQAVSHCGGTVNQVQVFFKSSQPVFLQPHSPRKVLSASSLGQQRVLTGI